MRKESAVAQTETDSILTEADSKKLEADSTPATFDSTATTQCVLFVAHYAGETT